MNTQFARTTRLVAFLLVVAALGGCAFGQKIS